MDSEPKPAASPQPAYVKLREQRREWQMRMLLAKARDPNTHPVILKSTSQKVQMRFRAGAVGLQRGLSDYHVDKAVAVGAFEKAEDWLLKFDPKQAKQGKPKSKKRGNGHAK